MKALFNPALVKMGAISLRSSVSFKSIAAIALLMASATASASLYTFSFDDGVNSGNGYLTVENNHATAGKLSLTAGSETGTFNLFTGGPANTDSPSGILYFDNSVFYGSIPILTDAGLLFTGTVGNPATPSGYNFEGNFFSNDLNNGSYSYSFWTVHYNTPSDAKYILQSDNVKFSINAVPEPEEYTLMLIGSGLIAFQLRRRAKASA
jgi:hypothetical protein